MAARLDPNGWMRQTVKLSAVAKRHPATYKARNRRFSIEPCMGRSTITTHAVAARMPTCADADPQIGANPPSPKNTKTAAAAARIFDPDAQSVSPPHTADNNANALIDAKRIRF